MRLHQGFFLASSILVAGVGSAQSPEDIILSVHRECPADLNRDGRVDSGDILVLRADFNNDGVVNAMDLAKVLKNFGAANGVARKEKQRKTFDLTGDDIVDGKDVEKVNEIWQTSREKNFDLNGNGRRSGVFDKLLVSALFGECRSKADVVGNDHRVDGSDHGAILIGSTTPYQSVLDMNGDGYVNGIDLKFVETAWGDLPALSKESADLNRNKKIDSCDHLLAIPVIGLADLRGDANGDGRRTMADASFVGAFRRKALPRESKNILAKKAKQCLESFEKRHGATTGVGESGE